ncbi:GNAT family N-acetyltransferase [Halotia wernerae UHCC 0503]|nr:GNAT family N-acetyltransferase [Halotia wernerae UHCC 0503]
MATQSRLDTNRLLLRPLLQADAPLIQQAASNRAISDRMISIPHPYPNGEAERYVSRQIAEFEEGHSVTFVIERKLENSFCGIIEIRDIDWEHSQAELSFWLAVEAQGHGYMSEALQPMISFSFQELGLNRLCAYHMVKNPASGCVLQKNSFVKEGVLRQRVRKGGVFEDTVLLAILRQDWDNSKAIALTPQNDKEQLATNIDLRKCH